MYLSKAILFSRLFAVATSMSLRGGSNNNDERELITRIINGSKATEGRYPYAVSIQDDLGHFCGGSLIARDVVLSAAHCAADGEYKAVVGRHRLASNDGQEMAVKVELMHPDYDRDTTDNDFMLIFLEGSVPDDVDLVQVSPDVVPPGTDVNVCGWGDTNKDESIQELATELMEVEVTVMTNEECEQSESNEVGWEYNYNDQITANMMCAKSDGERDSCQGDSGGPLVIRSDAGDVQVGVVSWGIGCAHQSFPGVYARISSQYEWIRTNVCAGSSAPPSSFQCGSISATSRAASLAEEAGAQYLRTDGGWTTIVEEDFASGLGLFRHPGNNARYYTSAMGRSGVVRIADGEFGTSVLTSNQISLESSLFTRYKIDFSFYAIEMEHSDNLCLDYEIDDGPSRARSAGAVSMHSRTTSGTPTRLLSSRLQTPTA